MFQMKNIIPFTLCLLLAGVGCRSVEHHQHTIININGNSSTANLNIEELGTKQEQRAGKELGDITPKVSATGL